MNYIVWVKVNKAIWQEKLIQIPFIDIKEDNECLKIKCIDTGKLEKVIIKNFSIEYSKKESQYLFISTIMDSIREGGVNDLTLKIRQRKKQ